MFRKLAATLLVLSLCLTGCSHIINTDKNTRAEETFSVYYANGDPCKDVTEEMLELLQGSWKKSYNADGYNLIILGDTMSIGSDSLRTETYRIVRVYEVDPSWTVNGEEEFFWYYKALVVDYDSGSSYAMSIETGTKDRVRIDGLICERDDS